MHCVIDTVADRQRSAVETLDAIQPWLKKAGVTRLADMTGMDRIGIPVYASVRPDSFSLAVDSGKGTTKEQAKCSAAMEALERWAGDEVEIFRFRGREDTSPPYDKEMGFPFNKGAVYSSNRAYDLTWAIDYNTGEQVAVPYHAVKLYEDDVRLIEHVWHATTNGLSAGNTKEDAIVSGCYEVIERDGVNLAMIASRTQPMNKIATNTLTCEKAAQLVNMIEEAGAQVNLYDCTSEVGVPTYLCVIADAERGFGLHRGAGCHRYASVAMVRAICEAAQARCILLAGARDDITDCRHQRLHSVAQDIHWTKELAKEKATPCAKELPVYPESPMYALIEHGFRILVASFDISDAPFAVVKVLVPNMAGYFSDYITLGRP